MNKFKLWHLALICLAVFLIFGGIAAAAISTGSSSLNITDWSFPRIKSNSSGLFSSGAELSLDENTTTDIAGADSIIINGVSSPIEVTTTTGDNVQAHLYGSYFSTAGKIELEVTKNGGDIKILVKYPNGNAGVTTSMLKLDVQIPSDYYGNLSVNGVSSSLDIKCEGMKFDDVRFVTTSGKIHFEPINANSIDVDSVSGRIEGTLVSGKLNVKGISSTVAISGLTAESKIKTTSGKITVDVEAYDDLDLSSTSGSVEINLKTEDDFYVDFDTISGRFDCDIPLTVKSQKRTGFEGYTADDNVAKFDVGTTSGSLKINKNY